MRRNKKLEMVAVMTTPCGNGFPFIRVSGSAFLGEAFVSLEKQALLLTPAMAAGVCDRLWTVEELVEPTSA
jgi:hypothetical protein